MQPLTRLARHNDMKLTMHGLCAAFLLLCAASLAAPPERVANGNRLISRSDPAVTVELPRSARYVGADRWDLYGICDAELHLFVEADRDRRIKALYWIQFEGYLPSNSHVYDYSADEPVTFAGRRFWQRARFAPSGEPQKPGSDGEHVRQLLARAGYQLPPHLMNVRLVHLLDDTRRKELMFIYAEAADAFDAGVVQRAKRRIRLAKPAER